MFLKVGKQTPLALVWLGFLAAGCSDPDGRFPDGFLFGVATSGFKLEMGCPTESASTCGDTESDWYQFATSPEMIADASCHLSGQDPLVVGPGHYELYPADLDLTANQLHANAIKISIEWSRIFPQATFEVDGFEAMRSLANRGAIDHYHAVLQAISQQGLIPLVVVSYNTLPKWLHDGVGCHKNLSSCTARGWLDQVKTVAEITKYAGFLAQEFGADTDLWLTFNSPFQLISGGYVWPSASETHPPAVLVHFSESKTVMKNLIEAHAKMYQAIRTADLQDRDGDGVAALVGLGYNLEAAAPQDPEDPHDQVGAEDVVYLWNQVFLNSVILGQMDVDLDGNPEYRPDLVGQIDFLGINYYSGVRVRGISAPAFPGFSPHTRFDPLDLEVVINPKGFYEVVMWAHKAYSIPMIITENGVHNYDDDDTGPSYLVQHLGWLMRAISQGADVRGYFYGDLMDGFDWNHGRNSYCGLFAVDKDDPQKKRTPRQTAAAFTDIALESAIPEKWQNRYPLE